LICYDIGIVFENPSFLIFFQNSFPSACEKTEYIATVSESHCKEKYPEESTLLCLEKLPYSLPV
jgi:hypothetical protein